MKFNTYTTAPVAVSHEPPLRRIRTYDMNYIPINYVGRVDRELLTRLPLIVVHLYNIEAQRILYVERNQQSGKIGR